MIKKSNLFNSLFKEWGVKLLTTSSLLALYSCQKEEFVTSQQEKDEPKVEQSAVLRTEDDMKRLARVNFGAETRSAHDESIDNKEIVVFPLKIDGLESNLYVVVNYTDNTTVITTEYVNYPADILVYFDDVWIEKNSSLDTTNIPLPFLQSLKSIDNSVLAFSQNDSLVNTKALNIETKSVDVNEPPLDFLPSGPPVIEYGNEYGVVYSSHGPFLQTKWGQQANYNATLSNDMPVGCVAVAIGQLFRYYKHPSMFDSYTIQYDYMPDAWHDDVNTATYTAPFLVRIANGVNTRFGKNGSGALMSIAGKNFIRKYYNVDSQYTGKRFESKDINNCAFNIRNGKPVLISGADGILDGHAWVIDGYRSEGRVQACVYRYYDKNGVLEYTQHLENTIASFSYFHHNWGWYGRCNAWINVHADLVPKDENGMADSNYTNLRRLYYCTKK